MKRAKKTKKQHRILISIGAILLVISVGIAVALGLNKILGERSSNGSGDDKNNETQVDVITNTTAIAEQQASDSNLKGAIETYDGAINSASDNETKASFYGNKATLLFNNQDYDGALEAAQQAYNLDNTSNYAAFVGQIARAKGDIAMALEYYKKARDLIDPEGPMAKFDEEYYTSLISELGG
jgi:tetratricopeptide (TPR) repeat protein